MARGLAERDETMQRRARALAEQADRAESDLGSPARNRAHRTRAKERWIEAVATVAAYRDRWNIDDDHLPLGPKGPTRSIDAINQRNLARAAIDRAARLSDTSERCTPSRGLSISVSSRPEDRACKTALRRIGRPVFAGSSGGQNVVSAAPSHARNEILRFDSVWVR